MSGCWGVDEEEEVEKGRRRKSRRRGNYYSSKLMTGDDRLELRRAAKVEGLADEIALLRMRLKKAVVEEEEDLEMLSLGMERPSRAVGMQHKMYLKKDKAEELMKSLEEILSPYDDIFHGPPREMPNRSPEMLPPGEEEDWKYRDSGS